jgi:hypothetical protein
MKAFVELMMIKIVFFLMIHTFVINLLMISNLKQFSAEHMSFKCCSYEDWIFWISYSSFFFSFIHSLIKFSWFVKLNDLISFRIFKREKLFKILMRLISINQLLTFIFDLFVSRDFLFHLTIVSFNFCCSFLVMIFVWLLTTLMNFSRNVQ